MGNVVKEVGIFQLFQHGIVGLLATYHTSEELTEVNSLRGCATNHKIAHDVGTCLRDGASMTGKCGLGNGAVIGKANRKRQLISARRIDAFMRVGWMLHLILVVRM